MHPVEPPKRGYGVKQNVLQVDREVEQDDGRNDDDPGWQCDQMKEAPSASIDNERKSDRGRWKDEAYQQRIENHDPEIAWPANVTTNRLLPSRTGHFPDRHGKEDAAKSAQPDIWLVLQRYLEHDLE
jgi:hypothetical protein